jgi:hypothetical protein
MQPIFQVTLSTTSATSQIRYTTDGQTPRPPPPSTPGPSPLSSTLVLKAIGFSTGSKLPSQAATATYILEPNATNAAILSISGEYADFFGPNGLIPNWSSDQKKPCYIEFFEPTTHALVVSQKSGIKVDGGAGGSRSQPQTSFRVEPDNNLFGEGNIQHQLIPSIERSSYETFYIRNGSNQYMYYPCKDAIETTVLAKGTQNNHSAYTPVNVYINGEYRGYYELREKQDADYFKQHYDISKNDLELLSLSYWYNLELRAVEGRVCGGEFQCRLSEFSFLLLHRSRLLAKGHPIFRHGLLYRLHLRPNMDCQHRLAQQQHQNFQGARNRKPLALWPHRCGMGLKPQWLDLEYL